MRARGFCQRLRRLYRESLQRRLPHGLMSWRYLWPGNAARIRLHRRFWWHSGVRWPRPIWLLVETWLWLRWVAWLAIPTCWRTIRRLGPAVARAEGISLARQGWRVTRLALAWCIHPRDGYRFHLYRAPDQALHYVYDTETSAHHAWRSAPLGPQSDSLRLIQDKAALAEDLATLGIPVVPTLARVPKGTRHTTLADLMGDHPRVFCKLNSGNRGRGAFTAWRTEQGLAGRLLRGQPLRDSPAVESAWQALLKVDDALVQPCLENHPLLANLAHLQEAVTLRYISQWPESSVSTGPSAPTCLSATLEIPAGESPQGHRYYCILPVCPDTGALLPFPDPLGQDAAVDAALRRIEDQALALPPVPNWAELARLSAAAHRRFTDIRALAWDWVLTPQGPVLLEGNTGWRMSMPQQLNGGFLQGVDHPDACRQGVQAQP